MLCDHCHEREAVVHLTQIVETAVTQLHLCEKCAAAKGIETTVSMPQHPLAGVLQAAQQQQVAAADAVRCSFCGTSQKDFRASGRLGCAYCYGAFAESLRDLLRRVHGSSQHVGRRYAAPGPETADRTGSLALLRERLRQAIEREEFETAASLRDEIRGME
jgi:protein arginine kinase activator